MVDANSVNNKKKIVPNKYALKMLTAGWTNKIFDLQREITSNQPKNNRGKILRALAITICTGLRPAELEKGVKLRLNEHNLLEIEIQGAKLAKNEFGQFERGIETRWLTINPSYNNATSYLTEEMKELVYLCGKREFEFSYCSSTLRKNVANLGKKYLLRYQSKLKDVSITPYTFRHLMSANIKSCTAFSDCERAQILGHLSIRSMQSYARGFRTKSGNKPIVGVRTTQMPEMDKISSMAKLAEFKKKAIDNNKKQTPTNQPKTSMP